MHPEGHDMFHTEQEICTMEPQRAALACLVQISRSVGDADGGNDFSGMFQGSSVVYDRPQPDTPVLRLRLRHDIRPVPPLRCLRYVPRSSRLRK